jgi:hypothetical protein
VFDNRMALLMATVRLLHVTCRKAQPITERPTREELRRDGTLFVIRPKARN